jgi:hypothetical protein
MFSVQFVYYLSKIFISGLLEHINFVVYFTFSLGCLEFKYMEISKISILVTEIGYYL